MPKSSPVRMSWVAIAGGVGSDVSVVPMSCLVRLLVMSTCKVTESLFMQVCILLSCRLEARLANQMKSKGKVLTSCLNFVWKDADLDLGKGSQVDRRCAAYVLAGVEALGDIVDLTCATDKANVSALPIMNTVFVTLDNMAVLACPTVRVWSGNCPSAGPLHGWPTNCGQITAPCQVDRLYESAEDCLRQGVKRKVQEEAALTSRDARHKAWLTRGRAGSKPGSWRPIKLFRTSARKFARNLDNQIRGSSRAAGLSHFTPKKNSSTWAPSAWRMWPSLAVSIDCGSDGVCAVSALQRHEDFMLNLLVWPDPSHAACRSIDQALRGSQLRPFWLMMLISFNLPHGPDRTGERGMQLAEAARDLFSTVEPNKCPRWQELAPRMLEGLGESGIELPGVDDPEVELWSYLKSRPWVGRTGERCNMNRFMSSLTAAKEHLPMWWIHLFERLFMCLEMDFMKSNRGVDRLVKLKMDHKLEDDGENGPLNPNAVTIDDKALRGTASNA